MTQPPPDGTPSLPPRKGSTDEGLTASISENSGTRRSYRADGPALPSLPGFRLESVLGRGGMGVVYRAADAALNRTVAVKMILAGAHASEQELARFLAEAEAVAGLRHRGIVQVHQVGRHEGLPFFVLEFCEGGSLADRIKKESLTPRRAAELVEAVARALAHAHANNIIHRDLKPENVLLAADGTPKVADFGLAKRLDVADGPTRTGAVMGTPAYMAPEQASGDLRRVGAACDVWALGAVLYRLLAGRPPFQGANAFETLCMVLEQEPAAPDRVQKGVPHDLSIICLKCLQKDPAGRYPGAAALADDLRRWLTDEPIQARPTGRPERALKWVRRNRGLAAGLAAAAAALLAGGGVSTYFAVDASRKASLAETQEAAAVAARDDLKTANESLRRSQDGLKAANEGLEKAVGDLRQSKDALEEALARTWLSPLAATPGPLTDAEAEALTQLAGHRGQPLAARFVAQVIRDPAARRRLAVRSAFALHAAVGLDAARRDEVERLLLQAMRAPDLTDDARADLALALASLGGLAPATAATAGQALAGPAAATTNPDRWSVLIDGLAAFTARMEPKEAAEMLCQVLARREGLPAVAGLVPNSYFQAPRRLAECLTEAVDRMQPPDAAAALGQAMSVTSDAAALQVLARSVSVVAARMDVKDARTALAAALRTPSRTISPYTISVTAQVLAALAARIAPAEAAATLTRAMDDMPDRYLLAAQARVVAQAAGRMKAADAAKVAAAAAAPILRALSAQAFDYPGQQALAEALAALGDRMDPDEADRASSQAAGVLLRDMAASRTPFSLPMQARGVAALAARMKPDSAADMSAQAADLLEHALQLPNPPGFPIELAKVLLVLSDRLRAQDVEKAADAVVGLLAGKNDNNFPVMMNGLSPAGAAAEVYVGLTARMDPSNAAATLARQLARHDLAPQVGPVLARGLSAAALRMEPVQGAAAIADAMRSAASPTILAALARGQSAVVARLGPDDAAAASVRAADLMVQALQSANFPPISADLLDGLTALAARMGPKDAANTFSRLLVMAQFNGPMTIPLDAAKLGPCFAALAARIEPRDAVEMVPHAATTLPAAQATVALAARMEPREAAAAIRQAMASLGVNNYYSRSWLAPGMVAAAGRLPPEEVDRVLGDAADALVQALVDTLDYNYLRSQAEALAILTRGMKPERAATLSAHVADVLCQAASKKAAAASALPDLAAALAAIADHLRPDDAARVLAQAAPFLSALPDMKDPAALVGTARGLTAVAARARPEDASRVTVPVADALARQLASAVPPTDPDLLAHALASAVTDFPSPHAAAALASALTGATSAPGSPAALAFLALTPAPAPCRLTTQELVDLLKRPFIVGPARRVVLDQLEVRYGRKFIDPWDFIRFAQDQGLGLDFTSPPKKG